MRVVRISSYLCGAAALLLPGLAAAWNPYPDYDHPPPEERVYHPVAHSNGTPFGYGSAPLKHAHAAKAAPAPANYHAPAVAAAQPAQAVYVPPPTYTPPPAVPQVIAPPQAYVPPAYTTPAPVAYTPPAQTITYYPPAAQDDIPSPRRVDEADSATPAAGREHGDQWRIGVEGFGDRYREPDPSVDIKSLYGGIGVSYQTFDLPWEGWYTGGDARFAYGTSDYKSPDGKINGIPEQEYEARWKFGYSNVLNGRGVRYYSGLYARYYHDDFKGYTAPITNAGGYDRNILQFFLPVGIDFVGSYGDWGITSNVEYEQLIRGFVSSRLGTIPGYENAWNRQTSGFGLRADVMFSHPLENGDSYEFGPFVRYWDIADSEPDNQAGHPGLYEPQNTRFQFGARLNYLF